MQFKNVFLTQQNVFLTLQNVSVVLVYAISTHKALCEWNFYDVLPNMSIPDELTQCFFYQNHWHLKLHNAHGVRRRTGSSQAPVPCHLNKVDWNTGVPDHHGSTDRPPEESTCIKRRGFMVNDFGEIIIICMFSLGQSMNMCVEYST